MTDKSVIKKYIIFIVIFLVIALLCIPLYDYFKSTNNQLQNEILSISIENSLLGKNDELLSKADLYYNLTISTKYIGFSALGISIILFLCSIYKKLKTKE